MFDHRNNVVGSKMAREMLRFTIETPVGREGRICETAVAGLVRATFVAIRTVTVVLRMRSGKQCAE